MSTPKILSYELPEEKIAKYPLEHRDRSKLLHYNKGKVSDHQFFELADLIDSSSTLFFNDTKVIPARLFFTKDTGALIEVFLLEPILPSPVVSQAMEATGTVVWQCMVGNYKKWKDQTLKLHLDDGSVSIELSARIYDREKVQIEFTWDDLNYSLAEIIELAGKVPLPPYLNRESEEGDKERYQTVYSQHKGAVAAPTAGLHFTEEVLDSLLSKGIKESFLTLHVSAGTFQPLKVEDPKEHPMHAEQMVVSRNAIEDVFNSHQVIAVGTTSMRTLESLFWFGVRLLNGNEVFDIAKLEIYQKEPLPTRKEAFEAILNHMDKHQMGTLHGSTEIFIMGDYPFKVCDGLITNFHQPGSTLLMLISSFLNGDWEKVYDHALENNYRFLSYGDSSLLMP
jgi:S-adenosylmethionine:tRNA ribosyltransferase-isomerase